ncbi:MAG: DUF3416 domain-containing protein [Candidatus Eisenbacteria bacterium]|nr:DUF3416 domain-containing protein [Candidatus Latescibacterota bacterium]MBD3301326.1 DUF3416 domain-containing protein [Candidatus Eisenbacteria bacterium]
MAPKRGPKTRSLPPSRPTRIVIERVRPEIDCGRHPIKRVVGEEVSVTADIHAEGHDRVAARLLHRSGPEADWSEAEMVPLGNDRWEARFAVEEIGSHEYTIEAWIDHFETWRSDLEKRVEAGEDVSVDLQIGAQLIEEAARRAGGAEERRMLRWANQLRSRRPVRADGRIRAALDEDRARRIAQHPERRWAARYERTLRVTVEPERARFSAWYELFPRSTAAEPGRHGTFRDVEARLPYVEEMGFDVLYLPPIHPIGRRHRKGPNGALEAGEEDPGSPWAIGGPEGGHREIHPELGSLKDFRRLVRKAEERGIAVALDIAFQCSPDHPYVREHPEWFRQRPDGTIQYAENPPKKYQDIYPFDFECEDWRGLWKELLEVVRHWIDQGVRIFRVDNPHTKPYAFWEWMIGEVRRTDPDVLFLSEAFTRPKVMARLAKVGFSQSYTYFTWRRTAWELRGYLADLTRTELAEYFRPNFWPNTPDILTEELQIGGRAAFMKRLVLAATLSASYGIYGPAFELCVGAPLRLGGEEYLDSEKYQIQDWDLDDPVSLRHLIARINRIRRSEPALQQNRDLRFLETTNDRLLAYAKGSRDPSGGTVVVVVNLEPEFTHSGYLTLPTEELGLEPGLPFQVHDLLTEARYLWHGGRNYVEVTSGAVPAHIFRIRRRTRTERDFDYYL